MKKARLHSLSEQLLGRRLEPGLVRCMTTTKISSYNLCPNPLSFPLCRQSRVVRQIGPLFTQRDTFEVDDDSEAGIDSQNEEDVPTGEREIALDGMYFISYRDYVD